MNAKIIYNLLKTAIIGYNSEKSLKEGFRAKSVKLSKVKHAYIIPDGKFEHLIYKFSGIFMRVSCNLIVKAYASHQ